VFTGIIEAIGSVRRLTRRGADAQIEIVAPAIAATAGLGDSIAVEGVCLTVAARTGKAFTCDLSAETLSRTALGGLRVGAPVNLERPLALGDRVGGHLVTGHVDAVGHILGRTLQGGGAVYRIGFPHTLAPLLVHKGSVAVDGISLTVATLTASHFEVAAISYTLQETTLGKKRAGDPVNLEADLIGKYVARLSSGQGRANHTDGLTLTVLKEYGFA
jgi:riboflavin synthase